MTEVVTLAMGLVGMLIFARYVRDEWRAIRRYRSRDEFRHVLGARQWWGRR